MDWDQGQNVVIYYSIFSGNVVGQFYLYLLSGILDVINFLDFEDVQKYLLSIKVQDGGWFLFINFFGVVFVQVLDVNDNEFIFVSSLFQVMVLENVFLGYFVVYIQVVDVDLGENVWLYYCLVDIVFVFLGGGSVGFKNFVFIFDFFFQIYNSFGWIMVCVELDCEEVEYYSFGVEVVDYGLFFMSFFISVFIMVLDVNDNDLVFMQFIYEFCLNEDVVVGSSVLILQVCDCDVNSVIIYQFMGGNIWNCFVFSSQRGGGFIILVLFLDYKQEQQYVLVVMVFDGI